MKYLLRLVLILILVLPLVVRGQYVNEVRVWEDTLILPTYVMNPNDVNPEFFKNDSYQGASRVIYPYPLMDNFTNKKIMGTYKGLFLENEYIKLCILPELGGKLFYATDKTNNYEIFYRQHVIKPAHIGMLGAWISGGIEWCVFHHHRASTMLPMEYNLSENPDGSKTIWIGETEPRQRMRWVIGVTLHPGKSLIDVNARLINSTESAHSMLYWANVATHVNENYQIFFPPSTQYAVFHAKNSFSHWPVTVGTYNGFEYYKGNVDASWWKNHPNPVSFFAFNLKEGFLAGYDFEKDAGTLHVANPHIVAGAKLWEWGPGPEGSFWDTKVLTDSDGPYAELMTGAFSDNQPDYSWIKPYEVREFRQYWYPIRQIKGVKNANTEACLNLELANKKVIIALNTTSSYSGSMVELRSEDNAIYSAKINIDPSRPFYHELSQPEGVVETDLKLTLLTSDGRELISYQPKPKKFDPGLPEEVKPSVAPKEIATTEELYLTGLRLKQFHNAQVNALEYFEEALKRDPLDIRSNIQMGLDRKQKGLYGDAANYFRKALVRLTRDYTRPYDCEAMYNLGLVLFAMEKYDDAYDTLYRAAWDFAYRSAAYLQLARISCIKNNYARAREELSESLKTNTTSTSTLNLMTSVLRMLGNNKEVTETALRVRNIDPLDSRSRYELFLNHQLMNNPAQSDENLTELKRLLLANPESYLELAVDYMNSGFNNDAEKILNLAAASGNPRLSNYPTINYYLGYLRMKAGDRQKAGEYYSKAESLSTDFCFPFRLETIRILDNAIRTQPNPAKAHYYLGNILYDRQPWNALAEWEKSVSLDKGLSIAWRNLGWGSYYARNDIPKSIQYYETAIQTDKTQPKYYYELDLIYEENNSPLADRLKLLTENHDHVVKRESSLSREIWVLLLNDQFDKAIEYLKKYDFHAQEGTRNLHDVHVDAYLLKGLASLRENKNDEALENFKIAEQYPENQQIGMDPDYFRLAQIYFLTGLALEKTGNKKLAKEYFTRSANLKLPSAWHIYYSGLAMRKLGRETEAENIFEKLRSMGEEGVSQSRVTDYFAKFGNMGSENKRISNGYLCLGLYHLANNKASDAENNFRNSMDHDLSNIWAREFLKK